MAFLEISAIRKSFGATQVVKHFDLAVEKGEFISFLGPSGCGKTTVLRMVAGFETPTSGQIIVDGKDVTNLPANQRNVGMVFQAYALFPNMTIAQNIAFGPKIAKASKEAIDQRVTEMLDLIKLPHIRDRYPYQLSGGQQQRVALARALAVRPSILLLDEPLSALDAKVRVSLRDEIRAVQRELGITTIFVTHDQEEALSMSDRVVVMYDGKADQIGKPFDIYNFPKTRFVAGFVGTLNVLNGTYRGNGQIEIDGNVIHAARGTSALAHGQAVTVAIRPESILAAPLREGQNGVSGVVEDVTFLGALVRLRVKVGSSVVTLDTFNSPGTPPPERGILLPLSFGPEDVLVLDEA